MQLLNGQNNSWSLIPRMILEEMKKGKEYFSLEIPNSILVIEFEVKPISRSKMVEAQLLPKFISVEDAQVLGRKWASLRLGARNFL